MIHVLNDLYIDVDENNYTVKIDRHSIKVDKKTGAEVKEFLTVGYYTSLYGAILGAKDYSARKLLKDEELSLVDALKCVLRTSNEFEDLLRKAIGENDG